MATVGPNQHSATAYFKNRHTIEILKFPELIVPIQQGTASSEPIIGTHARYRQSNTESLSLKYPPANALHEKYKSNI